jgi:hypothetical protein
MRVVAGRLGVKLESVERQIAPILANRAHEAEHLSVPAGATAGFEQRYVGVVDGRPWFEALFLGHVDPIANGTPTRDAIHVRGPTPVDLEIEPGLNPQIGTSAVVANSLRRVVEGPPGWLTVGDLPPAHPW